MSTNDYDFEPKSAPSVFLNLKEKDQTVVVRLASSPYREPKIWKGEGTSATPIPAEKVGALSEAQWVKIMTDPDYRVSEAFHWIVIDREDGKAKIFSTTAGVYKSIKEYAMKAAWGDPTLYDLEITRTEQPGRGYYSVSPYPEKGPLSNDEMMLVEEIDMKEKVPNARRTNEKQLDDTSEYQASYKQANAKKDAGSADALASPEAPADEGSEVGSSGYDKAKAARDKLTNKKAAEEMDLDLDINDQPIDLSEIPF